LLDGEGLEQLVGEVWVGLRIAFTGCVESRGSVQVEPCPGGVCNEDEVCNK
jgi:hypothetical protein